MQHIFYILRHTIESILRAQYFSHVMDLSSPMPGCMQSTTNITQAPTANEIIQPMKRKQIVKNSIEKIYSPIKDHCEYTCIKKMRTID